MTRAAALALLLIAAACGGGGAGDGDFDGRVAEGVVVDVDGSLADVRSFTIRTGDGADLTFSARDGVRFHGAGPLGHLRSHLTTGEPVEVSYETLTDGSLEAVEVRDAGG